MRRSWRDLKESRGKKAEVVRPHYEERRGVCGKRNDDAESGRGQEKRRTEVEMDGQHQRRPEAERIDERRRAGPSQVEKINQTHRPHTKVGDTYINGPR